LLGTVLGLEKLRGCQVGMLDFDLGDFLSYLRSAKSGFTSMVKRHPRGLAYLTLLYSVLFMYFQQTLLVEGLSYTLGGTLRATSPAREMGAGVRDSTHTQHALPPLGMALCFGDNQLL